MSLIRPKLEALLEILLIILGIACWLPSNGRFDAGFVRVERFHDVWLKAVLISFGNKNVRSKRQLVNFIAIAHSIDMKFLRN